MSPPQRHPDVAPSEFLQLAGHPLRWRLLGELARSAGIWRACPTQDVDFAIVGAGFVGNELYGFTFGQAVSLPNQILELDTETGKAKLEADQSATLDVVFGASDVRRLDAATATIEGKL